MKVKQFIESANLDWSDFHFEPDGGSGFLCPFQITPEDFITFAKADFFNADSKGMVNALSNAKRAVDCQADSFLTAIGLDPDRLDKQLGKAGIGFLDPVHPKNPAPLKFRFLQSLGFATPSIISRMRRLRNLLEHEYRKPRSRDVSDAIDIAELFVAACRGKMKSPMASFGFGSGISDARGLKEIARNIQVQFDEEQRSSFVLRFWNVAASSKQDTAKPASLVIKIGDFDYVPLLKLTWKADWERDMTAPIKTFLTETGVRFPASKFRVL